MTDKSDEYNEDFEAEIRRRSSRAWGWSDERRAAQSRRAREQRPWDFSTGPNTERGKARSALNAIKHSMRSVLLAKFRFLLSFHNRLLNDYVNMRRNILIKKLRGLIINATESGIKFSINSIGKFIHEQSARQQKRKKNRLRKSARFRRHLHPEERPVG
jgi:hypothetical protein